MVEYLLAWSLGRIRTATVKASVEYASVFAVLVGFRGWLGRAPFNGCDAVVGSLANAGSVEWLVAIKSREAESADAQPGLSIQPVRRTAPRCRARSVTRS